MMLWWSAAAAPVWQPQSGAHDEGASVLIVEKMPTIGGNTIKASAGMNAAETRFQRVKGIRGQQRAVLPESLKGGGNKNNPELLHRFVENAPEAIEWLARRGIMLNDITTTGGMSVTVLTARVTDQPLAAI